MSQTTPIVFVVDDDMSVREALDSLIRQAGWQPEVFESAQEFLARPRALVPSCLGACRMLRDVRPMGEESSIVIDEI